jgi:hypothetical protein
VKLLVFLVPFVSKYDIVHSATCLFGHIDYYPSSGLSQVSDVYQTLEVLRKSPPLYSLTNPVTGAHVSRSLLEMSFTFKGWCRSGGNNLLHMLESLMPVGTYRVGECHRVKIGKHKRGLCQTVQANLVWPNTEGLFVNVAGVAH